MIEQSDRQRPPSVPRRTRRGQSLVEFALTLPILLMLMFGIVEFGRIFQAWVTIQNAARMAARYGTTGAYDTTQFPNLDAPWSPGTAPGMNTSGGIPCPFAPYPADSAYTYKQHWEQPCDSSKDDNNWLRKDILRLVGITNEAHKGAAGLALQPWMRIPGTDINTEPGGDASNLPGWFHVYICSSRDYVDQSIKKPVGQPNQTRYDFNNDSKIAIRHCDVNEDTLEPTRETPPRPPTSTIDNVGTNQYDAGGPGDFLQVVIFFNHPLITPLGLTSNGYIQLQARRMMVNESFRSGKFLQQPNPGPPLTASDTPTQGPTDTRTPSLTPSNTSTPSFTPSATGTVTPTPSPQCRDRKSVV